VHDDDDDDNIRVLCLSI